MPEMSTTHQFNDIEIDPEPASPVPVTRENQHTRISRLASIAMSLEILAIAVWLGGLVAIGAIVAPVTFHEVRAVITDSETAKTLAGNIVGGSLRIFNYVSIACALILAIGMASRDPRLRKYSAYKIAGVALFLLCCSVAILTGVLFPAMDTARLLGHMTQFDKLHKTYERISEAQMLVLVIFTCCYGSIKAFRFFDD